MKKKKIKNILCVIILLTTFVYLIYQGVSDTMVYYLTVNELLEKGDSIYKKKLRLGGKIVKESIKLDSIKQDLKFKIYEGDNRVLIKYHGIVPDSFMESEDVIVEGIYLPGKIFEAAVLMPKCPSKYETNLEQKKGV